MQQIYSKMCPYAVLNVQSGKWRQCNFGQARKFAPDNASHANLHIAKPSCGDRYLMRKELLPTHQHSVTQFLVIRRRSASKETNASSLTTCKSLSITQRRTKPKFAGRNSIPSTVQLFSAPTITTRESEGKMPWKTPTVTNILNRRSDLAPKSPRKRSAIHIKAVGSTVRQKSCRSRRGKQSVWMISRSLCESQLKVELNNLSYWLSYYVCLINQP